MRQYIIILLHFCWFLIHGEDNTYNTVQQNSLYEKTYDTLEDNFRKFKNDPIKAEVYAKAYLEKSIRDKDTIKQADAWYFLSKINSKHKPLISAQYADSIVSLTKGFKNDTYPAKGFLAKAHALYQMGKYKEAIDQCMEADNYAKINNNEPQQLEVKFFVGTLKNDLEEHEEALTIFRTYFREIAKKYKEEKKYKSNYIKGLYALGDAYNRNGLYDSASIINKKGFEIASKNKAIIDPIYFTMSMGVTAYFKKNYDVGLDKFQEAEKKLLRNNDLANLAICYLYIGRINKEQNKINDAVAYFKKVDSIVEKTSDVFPDIMEVYEFLNAYYEEKGDLKNQLKYIERLIVVDSLLDSHYKYISKTIEKKYDAKELKRQQNEIILELERWQFIWIVSLLVMIFLLIIGFAYYYYRTQRRYHIKFKELLDEKDLEKIQSSTKVVKVTDLNMPEHQLNHIRNQLKVFIEEKRFLNNDVSVHNWAKAMDSNSKYLSHYINTFEKKSFNAYITELRINYAIEALKADTTLRRYNIKSIATEMGFNNVQSFSRAFRRNTGLYPSYFIKELEKENYKNRPPRAS